MHHIRLKRAQNLCNGLTQEEGEKVLSENKFSESEIKEFYGNEETVKTEEVSVKAENKKTKMALKDLETPEGWAKYKELALGIVKPSGCIKTPLNGFNVNCLPLGCPVLPYPIRLVK